MLGSRSRNPGDDVERDCQVPPQVPVDRALSKLQAKAEQAQKSVSEANAKIQELNKAKKDPDCRDPKTGSTGPLGMPKKR